MKNKKRQIASAILVLSFVCMMSLSAIAGVSDSVKIESWGNAVQKYVDNPMGENDTVKQSLAPADNVIILPQIEIDQAKDFYISAGYSDAEAQEAAIAYVKEINTLYQEAIKHGYAVTDDEISAHIEQMKVDFQTAENKDEIYDFINSFENEEAYWDFQFEMLKKDLPIQRYVADKENEYINRNTPNNLSAGANSVEYSDKVLEIQEEWVEQFEVIKDDAENRYEYKIE